MRTGSKVSWKWGSGEGHGKIAEKFERRVSRNIKGKRITRKGTADDPAYLIETDEGSRVLKLRSELKSAQ